MNFGDNMGELQRRIAATHEGGFRRKKTFEALAIQKGQKLIDLGCGGGQLVHEMALAVGETGLVYGLDPSSSQIHAAQEKCSEFKNVEFLQESAIKKYPLKMVHVIVCHQYKRLNTLMMLRRSLQKPNAS